MSTPDPDPTRPGAPFAGAADDVTVEQIVAAPSVPIAEGVPLGGTEPLLDEPLTVGAVPPAPSGGLAETFDERPELLVAASFAGGALAAIALRTLVRR